MPHAIFAFVLWFYQRMITVRKYISILVLFLIKLFHVLAVREIRTQQHNDDGWMEKMKTCFNSNLHFLLLQNWTCTCRDTLEYIDRRTPESYVGHHPDPILGFPTNLKFWSHILHLKMRLLKLRQVSWVIFPKHQNYLVELEFKSMVN